VAVGGDGAGGVGDDGGKAYGPGQVADGAEAAAIEEAAKASEGEAEHECGGEDIQEFEDGEFSASEVDDHDEDGGEDTAEEFEATGPDGEDFGGVVLVVFVPEVDDVHGSGAEDAGDEGVDAEVGDVVGVFAEPA